MLNIADPSMGTEREPIDYVPRPKSIEGLRVAIIENTKKNAEEVMVTLAAKLKDRHGVVTQFLMHKPQRDPLKEAQLEKLKSESDFVISGVGDCGACSSGALLDAIMLEKEGVPGIALITDVFDSTAREMAELWGVPEFRFVMMPHPLASMTSKDIDKRTDELVDKVVELLLHGQPKE